MVDELEDKVQRYKDLEPKAAQAEHALRRDSPSWADE